MFELTPENTVDYLRRQGWIGPGPVQVQAMGWGVSNLVLRAETPAGLMVVKQSRPRLRTRDAWFSDLNRAHREQEVMEFLYPLLPQPTVPRVLFVDRANFVFAMSHAPEHAQVWKETLLAGQVNPEIGQRAGQILGIMHEATAQRTQALEAFRENTVFIQLRVDPFYQRIQERRPEVRERVGQIIDQMLATRECLCHGDYSPKNILTHEQGFTLVDYETAHFGDPTMDLGFFLSHLILKAVKNQPICDEYFELTRAFWRAYSGEVQFRPITELEQRTLGHFAVCLLARIDGTSPVDYLPEDNKRESVRRIGRKILLDHVFTWEEVLAMTTQEMYETT